MPIFHNNTSRHSESYKLNALCIHVRHKVHNPLHFVHYLHWKKCVALSQYSAAHVLLYSVHM